MARISIEQVALTDLRYQALGRHYKKDRFWALGIMVYVWNQCQELGRHSLARTELQDIHPHLKGFPDALADSGLGRWEEGGTLYIAGTRGRIEWLNQLREQGRDSGRKGGEYGKQGGRPRNPQKGDTGKPPNEGFQKPPKEGLSETPAGGYMKNPPPTPTPTPTPVLSSTPPDSSTGIGDPAIYPSAEPGQASSAPDPVLLTFETVGREKAWQFVESHRARLSAAFPGLDVLGEARHAVEWMISDRTRRKTARGMPKFLYGWMERHTNRGPGGAPFRRPGPGDVSPQHRHAEVPFT